MNPFLDYCVDCGIQYPSYDAMTRFCPVCAARRCAPKRPNQHQTTPGVVTYLTTRGAA